MKPLITLGDSLIARRFKLRRHKSAISGTINGHPDSSLPRTTLP